MEQKTIEVKSRQKELYRYLRSEKGISDEECNFVIDQLVEEELEKLDSVEWKLNAIRRRLTKAARVLDKKVEHSIN